MAQNVDLKTQVKLLSAKDFKELKHRDNVTILGESPEEQLKRAKNSKNGGKNGSDPPPKDLPLGDQINCVRVIERLCKSGELDSNFKEFAPKFAFVLQGLHTMQEDEELSKKEQMFDPKKEFGCDLNHPDLFTSVAHTELHIYRQQRFFSMLQSLPSEAIEVPGENLPVNVPDNVPEKSPEDADGMMNVDDLGAHQLKTSDDKEVGVHILRDFCKRYVRITDTCLDPWEQRRGVFGKMVHIMIRHDKKTK